MFIKETITSSLTIEKSEFICIIKRCNDENAYKEFLLSTKKKYHDASHVCSACIIDNIVRSNDDGEPSGTAGKPILNVLTNNNLNKVAALVIRYFGGIKLGTGGLTRAYGQVTKQTLEKASFLIEKRYQTYSLKLPYDLSNKINNYLKNNTIIFDIQYREEVEYVFGIEDVKILDNIFDLTKGIKPLYLKDEIIEAEV